VAAAKERRAAERNSLLGILPAIALLTSRAKLSRIGIPIAVLLRAKNTKDCADNTARNGSTRGEKQPHGLPGQRLASG